MILLRGIAFPTSVFDILLIVIALGVGLFILYWVMIILLLVFFMLKYALTGRWKEFNDRMENDPGFLNFDKKTGKFNW